MKSDRFNYLLYGVNVVFLVFALSILVWLKSQFERDAESLVAKTCALFPRSVLGDPDNRQVRFAEWEDRADLTVAHSQLIRDLVIEKDIAETRGKRAVVVYPFYYAALHGGASPAEATPPLRREILADERGPYGAIYFDLNLSALNSVRAAIFTLAGLLTLTLAVLIVRLWSQERALTLTTVELEEKRQQLIRLERLALAGQLTANIFHDIRKPILNIRHELEDLTEALGHFAGASKGLAHIREQVDLFFEMLRDLNIERFVRSETGESEYVEAPRIVEQACHLVQYEQGGMRLDIQSEPGLPLVYAPPYRLIQVFSNLALNAYQAMEGKGELRIHVRRAGDWVEVEVSDTGPGIPPHLLPRIFTPFFTTKEDGGGSGLGLYISRQIVEDLRGEITAASKEGMGATFTVHLPAAAPER